MNDFEVTVSFKSLYRVKEAPHYRITTCRKVVNTITGNIINHTLKGYFIDGRYIKRKHLNNYLEKIPTPKQDYSDATLKVLQDLKKAL